MNYRYLGRSALQVSPLCLGTMMFGGATDEATSRRIIDKARDEGVNFIDTADVYCGGKSEEVVGRAIKEQRHRWVLATKFGVATSVAPNEGGQSRKWIFQSAESSLRRLGTDYIDLLYFHKADIHAPFEEGLRAIQDLMTQGKLRYYGVSNFKGWRIAEVCRAADAIGMDRPIASQPLYNMVDRLSEVEQLPAAGRVAGSARRHSHKTNRMAAGVGGHRTGRRQTRRLKRHEHGHLRACLGTQEPVRERRDCRPTHRGTMG